MQMPKRPKNADVRSREHLTPPEVERLRKAAERIGRYGKRDALMIRMAYIHGFRVSELCSLQWTDIDLDSRMMHVRRRKRGLPATHPLQADETKALRKLAGNNRPHGFVFTTERGTPLSPSGFLKIVRRAGELAGIGLQCHPHMLRHGCGYKLANDGTDTRAIQGYLGHRNISCTVRYTELASDRFKEFKF